MIDRDRIDARARVRVRVRERTGAGRDIPPAQYKALCNHAHARGRAFERYGLALANEHLLGFADAFREGRNPVVILRVDSAGGGKVRGAVRVDGAWIPLVYDPATHSIVTVLPHGVLDQYDALLRKVAGDWEGPPPDAPGTIRARGTGIPPRGATESFPWLCTPDDEDPPAPPPRYRSTAEVDRRRRTLLAFVQESEGHLRRHKGDTIPPEQIEAWKAWRDRVRLRVTVAHDEMRALKTAAIDRS
jgi:hypothetical protein